jgi:hypothetical protein
VLGHSRVRCGYSRAAASDARLLAEYFLESVGRNDAELHYALARLTCVRARACAHVCVRACAWLTYRLGVARVDFGNSLHSLVQPRYRPGGRIAPVILTVPVPLLTTVHRGTQPAHPSRCRLLTIKLPVHHVATPHSILQHQTPCSNTHTTRCEYSATCSSMCKSVIP